jgi:hypothetical protein
MPNLEKSGLGLLKDFAKDSKWTIILTGEMVEMNSALLQGSFEKRNKAEEGRAKAKLSEDKALRNGNTDSLLDRAKFFREHVRTILTLATGSFVLSVTFLHDIAPKPQHAEYLKRSWVVFGPSSSQGEEELRLGGLGREGKGASNSSGSQENA